MPTLQNSIDMTDDVVKKIHQDGMPHSAIKQHISEPLKLGS